MAVIETRSLSKAYGRLQAVNNLSIKANEGEIYGFIGLNGAGKTTTIRMLLGMIKPSAGSVSLFGRDIGDQDWSQVGYLVEAPSAYPDLTVEENLEVYCYYRKLRVSEIVDSIMRDLGLDRYRKVKSKNLSLGNSQRLGLAKALMHKPKLLVLDEPINGLDPSGIVEIRELLGTIAANGTTVFLSSHILGEISKVAHRIGIIHEGQLIKELLATQVESELIRTLTIEASDAQTACDLLRANNFAANIQADGMIHVQGQSAIDERDTIAALLIHSQIKLRELSVHIEDLESYFLKIINQSRL